MEREMKTIMENTRGVSVFVQLNVDRLFAPLLIMTALFLAGAMFGYATVH
ncbi:hypothetical protein HKCCSP123_16275 [Rhodobacterales bacterium HKCCSP123]|nr:hypothetical protein [Rhodobacterales bacterium HKCCSP123]